MKIHILAVLTTFITFRASAQTTVAQNGHTIKFSEEQRATVIDPVTHSPKQTTSPVTPILLDGKKIYTTQDISSAPTLKNSAGKDIKLCTFIFQSLKSSLERLDDGYYVPDITNAIIDSSGKLIYWQFSGIKQFYVSRGTAKYNYSDLPMADSSIPPQLQSQLKHETTALLEHLPQTTPGKVGKLVGNVTGYLFSKGNYIEVRNHKAILHEDYWSL